MARNSQRFLMHPWAGAVDLYGIAQGYGYTSFATAHPEIYGGTGFHDGIDFGLPCGTQLFAAAAGTVAQVNHYTTGFGNHVIIDHGNGYSTLYGHMSTIAVTTGAVLAQGQAFGASGTSGSSTACHLHFKVMRNGGPVNPLDYLSDTGLTAPAPPAIAPGGDVVSGPPRPPDLVVTTDIPALPPEDAIPIQPVGQTTNPFAPRQGQPTMLLWLDGAYLPVMDADITLSGFRTAGSYSATLSLEWLQRTNNLRHLDTLQKRRRSQIILYAGYVPDVRRFRPSDLTPLFTGLAEAPEYRFSGADETLTLSGPDLSGLFSTPDRLSADLTVIQNLSAGAIATKLAALRHLSARIGLTDSPVSAFFSSDQVKTRQHGSTEWDLLTQLAAAESFVCYLDGTTLIFDHIPSILPAPLPVSYRVPGIRSRVTDLTIRPQPHSLQDYEIVVLSYDTRQKTTASGTASLPTVAVSTTGNPDSIQQITIYERPNTPQVALDKRAQAELALYRSTEVLLDLSIDGVLPLHRSQPLVLRSPRVPDTLAGERHPYYPATIHYHYTVADGITMQISGTNRPFASQTTETAAASGL